MRMREKVRSIHREPRGRERGRSAEHPPPFDALIACPL